MQNAVYDSALIQRLANRLDAKSRIVVVKYTIFGALLFSGIFYFTASINHGSTDVFGLSATKSLGVGLLIGVVLGFIWGQKKSSQLKLQSQLALCQLQIEKNTRISPGRN